MTAQRPRTDEGGALVLTLVVLLLVSVVSLGVLSIAQASFTTSGAVRDATGEDYAADSGIEVAVREVLTNPVPFINLQQPCSFDLQGVNDVPSTRVTCTLDALPRPPLSHGGGTTGASSAPSSSITLAVPAGARPGDLLLAQITWAGGSTVSTSAPGWTAMATRSQGTAVSQALLQKRVAAADPTSWTFSFTTAGAATVVQSVGALHRYTGVGTPVPLAGPFDDGAGGGDTMVVRLAAQVPAGNMIIGFYSHARATEIDPPARTNDLMTPRSVVSGTGGLSSLVADYVQFNNGTGGNWRAEAEDSGAWVGHVLALPAGARPSLLGTGGVFTASVDGQARVRARISFVDVGEGRVGTRVTSWSVLR